MRSGLYIVFSSALIIPSFCHGPGCVMGLSEEELASWLTEPLPGPVLVYSLSLSRQAPLKAFLIFLIVDLKFKALVFLFSMEFSSFIYI
jgi:hypothetical protein